MASVSAVLVWATPPGMVRRAGPRRGAHAFSQGGLLLGKEANLSWRRRAEPRRDGTPNEGDLLCGENGSREDGSTVGATGEAADFHGAVVGRRTMNDLGKEANLWWASTG